METLHDWLILNIYRTNKYDIISNAERARVNLIECFILEVLIM